MRRLTAFLAAALLLCAGLTFLAPAARANGILLGNSERTESRGGPLSLVEHRVHATVKDRVAEVTVEQQFHNRSSRQLEGTYLFPLPRGATVSRFAMTMGGRMVEGEIIEAAQARRIYEGIVRNRRDPGLLEYVGRGLFRAKVFPIEARSDLTIRLTYQQVLSEDDGTIEFRYPLATARFHGAAVQRVLVDVAVESSVDLKAIYAATHRVEITRDGERKARLTHESTGRRQTSDLLLYFARSPEDVGFSLLSHRRTGEDGTFMAVLAPRSTLAVERRVPKDVVFVLDTSGSMAGPKIEQARRALAYGIQTLNPGDRFNVVAFATTVRSFRDVFVEATAESKKAAVAWTAELGAYGGTNIEGALVEALGLRAEGRLFLLAFLTDGKPTVGVRDPDEILTAVTRANPDRARIFTFGIDENLDVTLLDRIAEATGGAREYVTPEEDVEIVTGRFFRKINSPVLRDLKVDLGAGVYDVFPPTLGDLFAGEQLVVFGRYRKSGPRTVKLEGRIGRQDVEYHYHAALREGEDADFLPRLWAHRKVAFLLDEIRLHGADPELEHEVIRLATRHAIITPYTAGLVVEEMRELDEDGRRVGAVPVIRDAAGRDHVETDNDLPFEESLGRPGIAGKAPSRNGLIGLGGGSGGAFGMSRGGARNLGSGGGGRRGQVAVEDALRWLAWHQSPNGSWDADGFDAWCNGKPQTRLADAGHAASFDDVVATGFALEAFLGAGYTNRGRHPFAKTVSKGLRYLKNVQDGEGCFGPRDPDSAMLAHATAALAMVEAYGMTGSPIYKGSAQKALDFLARAACPGGGWGAVPNATTPDVFHTAFAVAPLASARLVVTDAVRRGRREPLRLDPEAEAGARRFLERSTNPDTASVAGGLQPTALALWARILLGEDVRHSAYTRRAAQLLPPAAPVVGAARADPLTWYVGTMALFQTGGQDWRTWNAALKSAVVDSCRKDSTHCEFRGSWDPFGETGRRGGRVVTTALMAMSQEVYYRYDRAFGTPAAAPEPPSVAQQAADSERIRDLKNDAQGRIGEGRDGLDRVRGRVKRAGDRTFLLRQGGRWVDTAWDGEGEPEVVEAYSPAYFALLEKSPEVARILAVGERVVFVLDGTVYEVKPKEKAPEAD